MSTPSEYRFIPTDPEEIIVWMTAAYEEIMGVTVKPASPDQLFIRWIAKVIILERVLANYAANQNIPSRAEGKNLDALAEMFYMRERPQSKAATCTMRFCISEPQTFAVLIPQGTRVTDARQTLVWDTLKDVYVNAGDAYADAKVQCQTKGTEGNGFVAGQINSIVDTFPYFLSCENLTESDGGMDAATDKEFYNLLRLSMDGYSDAGARGAYVYFAKQVSTEIADVVPNSPTPGVVYIYVLMKGGEPAGEEMKTSVFNACNPDHVRPMTDWVHMGDPEIVPYQIDFTYYLYESNTMGAASIQARVNAAVQEYIAWQSAKLGRDINPSVLTELLMKTGIKRVDLRQPVFTSLRDGKLDFEKVYEYPDTVPQLAKSVSVSVVNGGYEDE